MRRIEIPVSGAPHQMVIAPGASVEHLAAELVDALRRRGRDAPTHCFLLLDAAVASTHGARCAGALAAAGLNVDHAVVTATERDKSVDTARIVAQRMVGAGIDRHGVLVAVGGGIVCDLGGFVAATYLRAIPSVLVPTTLLAMVDAAIGGKTGVNLELPGGALGKNLIGTFTQPTLIVADPSTLSTLPPRVLRCGLAECVKHAMVADASLLDALEADAPRLLAGEPSSLTALIERSAEIKIAVVIEDERELGRRAHLNLGHTFGHALESETDLRLMHGEAVALGLVAACQVAVVLNRLGADGAARIERLLSRLGLPTRLDSDAHWPVGVALERMGFDKKNREGRLHLVLPRGIGRVEVVADPALEAVRAGWRHIGAVESPEDPTVAPRNGSRA